MATSSTQRDPRSIVTPDAFEVSAALLGQPLASPRLRMIALVIDLIVTGLVTAVTRSFALVLGIVAAVLFMRAGFKRTPVEGSVFGRAMRLSVGCLGMFIALVTMVVWASCGVGFEGDADEDRSFSLSMDGESAAGRVLGALAEAGVVRAFEDVETIEEAEQVTLEVIEVADEMDIERDELPAVLMDAVPEDAVWADEAEAMFDRLLRETTPATAPPASTSLAEEVATYTDVEALDAYLELLRSGTDDEESLTRRAVLGSRLAPLIAADTVQALTERIEELESTNRSQQSDLEDATAALAEAGSGGLLGGLREFVDELGFGFGWWAVYVTVFLSWWNGQTVGKRLVGIRVVRLDGTPITWWVAFERAGGYAAGFATGLLGFAQVYWDANRQAIHDRIVGTVVIDDKAEKVIDWESAL